jgi:hypothetical protein
MGLKTHIHTERERENPSHLSALRAGRFCPAPSAFFPFQTGDFWIVESEIDEMLGY